ncbi:succinate dehydrogenase [Nesidiocoris tenuis]|uniref:Succinate dehydrogenase [ubiquinone] cytochrome b small subunit n=1 Tax=Nesidiocoris tenuis TaxID=355587 RepID=A0ABN7B2U9_9HEMI|nr:succinate dehydrogenase [Nesidiocoris tenuis]
MSCLLRTTLGLCRATKPLGVSHLIKARPLTHLANIRIDQPTVHPSPFVSSLKARPLLLANKLESFSVTPAVSSRGAHDAHDHSKIWTLERLLSIALMPIVPLGVLYPNILFDLLISVATTMHVHWGVEAVVVDYVRPIIFGKLIPKLALGVVYAFSVVLLIGLLNLTFRGQGVGNSINTLWSM